jgi:adenosylcobinamide-phosphate synthase
MFELAALAYLIDCLFGEFPTKHPVVWMGQTISSFERYFYQDRVFPGALLVVGLISMTLVISMVLVYLCNLLPEWISLVLMAMLASTGLAMNMLHESVSQILTAKNPKHAISLLVSRDTTTMTKTDIYKAALETWAENLSDGVIAPLFYLLLFGLPGIAVYKAINTMDSMIAYKTPHYFFFGKTAAIVDDIANYIPARLTALLIVLIAKNKKLAWQCIWRDGHKLESPNAGYPIAAMAGTLGVMLGGDAHYHGQLKHKPLLGIENNPVNKAVLEQALAMKPIINGLVLSLLVAALLVK